MAKKVINEVNLQDMIAGLESSPAYSEYNEQILSGVLSANNKQTKPHHPVSSVERKQESGEHTEESSGTPKLSDKKYRRTSFEEYRQTFLQVPRIIDRKSVFVSASPRERLDRLVPQIGLCQNERFGTDRKSCFEPSEYLSGRHRTMAEIVGNSIYCM